MTSQPYIGVTGYTTVEEVRAIADLYRGERNLGHAPMFGFVSSAKKIGDFSRVGRQSPSIEQLAELAGATPRCSLPAVHYYTKEKTFAEALDRIFSHNHLFDRCKLVQLNMPWPALEEIDVMRERLPGMGVILQIPPTALSECQERVGEYAGVVEYCLVDPSAGHGRRLEGEHLDLVRTVGKMLPGTCMGIAGGLDAHTTAPAVNGLRRHYAEAFCIDAQGRLRTRDKSSINLAAAVPYVLGAHQLLSPLSYQVEDCK